MSTITAPFGWGKSGHGDLVAWAEEHAARTEPGADGRTVESCREESRRLGQVADAYAHGWIAGRSDRLTSEEREALSDLAYRFGHEYEHAAWMYATGQRVTRDGYARAWEHVVEPLDR